MATKQAVVEEPGTVRFKLASLPAIPARSYSGNVIKPAIIKAMARQYAAEARANSALDRLIGALRDSVQQAVAPVAGRYSIRGEG